MDDLLFNDHETNERLNEVFESEDYFDELYTSVINGNGVALEEVIVRHFQIYESI